MSSVGNISHLEYVIQPAMVLPSFTKTYHHSPYDAIDPKLPELSCKGKVVVITGECLQPI